MLWGVLTRETMRDSIEDGERVHKVDVTGDTTKDGPCETRFRRPTTREVSREPDLPEYLVVK